LPPLECWFGTSPIQAEKFRAERKAFGSATLATRAVASAGPMPGIESSRLLISLERCQARIRRSNSRICAFKARSWAPRAATQARATSGTRLSPTSATTSSKASTPWRPTGGGFELAQQVREKNPSLKVLYTTGETITDGMKALFVEGGIMLPKPYTALELTAAMKAILGKR
jgi:hypothetical protein